MRTRQRRPIFHLTCGSCRRRIGQSADVYLVDEEWERRFAGHMSGRIVCLRCANAHQESCELADGSYVPGHVRVPIPGRTDFDLWSHLLRCSTQRAAVLSDPASGLRQGAEAYLLSLLADPRLSGEVRERVEHALTRFRVRPG